MILNDVINEKYIFLKCEFNKLQFWAEDACGYVEDGSKAGIYNREDITSFGLCCYTEDEIKKKVYKKNIHFAVLLKDAIKYFM